MRRLFFEIEILNRGEGTSLPVTMEWLWFSFVGILTCFLLVCVIASVTFLLRTVRGTQKKVTVLLSLGIVLLAAEGAFMMYAVSSDKIEGTPRLSQLTQTS